jgi:beta-phosphoglucomutase-like phosphatase (HAD superfamily)
MVNNYLFLFDLDGTLVITDNIYYEIWSNILKEYNIFLTKDIFNNYIQGNNDLSVLNKLIPHKKDILIDKISNIKDKLFKKNIEKIKIIDGAYNFLYDLYIKGYDIGIVTNCNRETAELIINYLNLNEFIKIIIIGNECKRSKPYPDPYIKGIEYFNSINSKTIIFEDSKSGILSATSVLPKCIVGIETIYNKEELINCGVNITIKNYMNINLDEILNYNNINIIKLKNNIINSLSFPVKSIKIDEEKLKGGFISDVIKVEILKNDNKILYCIIKLENKKISFLSKMANDLGLYEREYYFYDVLSRYVEINYPKYYCLIYDDNYDKIGILMEDLFNKNYIINLNLNNENINTSLNIINSLAKMHSKFWNKNISKIFKELKKNNDIMFQPKWYDFINDNWYKFKKNWNHVLSENQINIGEYIVKNFNKIQNELSDTNLTVCHGDVKSPNIFYKKINENENIYEPYFIDWQYIIIGKGVQDLVFFLIESFDIDKIKNYTNLFKEYYYIKLKEYNILYERKDFEKDFINASYYFPFFVAIWFGTLNHDELIDKNFPYFFITKLFNFYDIIYK